MSVRTQGGIAIAAMSANICDASSKSAGRAGKVVATEALSNDFAPDAVFLCIELQGGLGNKIQVFERACEWIEGYGGDSQAHVPARQRLVARCVAVLPRSQQIVESNPDHVHNGGPFIRRVLVSHGLGVENKREGNRFDAARCRVLVAPGSDQI